MSASIVALVPAAGRSERMGRPKLILELGIESVIQRVVRALERSGASSVIVVAPPIEQPGAVVLADQARAEGAQVVHLPAPTEDMRATIQFGLDALDGRRPVPEGLLLAPGDSPGITAELVASVLRRFLQASQERIVVPMHDGKRGHPIALPWSLALAIPDLPAGVGVNALVESHRDRLITLPVSEPGAILDMDTPEDYRRWTT